MRLNIIRRGLQFSVASALLTAVPAHADQIIVAGTISSVFLSGSGNYDFRISLRNNGADALTGCAHSFAFMNADFPNYQAKVAALLSAQAQRLTVTATINRGAGNWCRLDEFDVSTQ